MKAHLWPVAAEHALALLSRGSLPIEEQLHYAIAGLGTDEEALAKLLPLSLTKGQANDIQDKYNRNYHPKGEGSLRSDLAGTWWMIDGEVSGRVLFDAFQALDGVPENADEAVARGRARYEFERTGFRNWLANLATLPSSTGRQLDKAHERAEAFYREAMGKRGYLTAEDESRLAQLFGFRNAADRGYREARDRLVAAAPTVVGTVAAGVTAVVTGGAALPVLGASLLGTVGTKAAIQGNAFEVDSIPADSAKAAVLGAVALGAAPAVAGKLSTLGTLGVGAASSAVIGAANRIDADTFSEEGMERLIKGALNDALIGAALVTAVQAAWALVKGLISTPAFENLIRGLKRNPDDILRALGATRGREMGFTSENIDSLKNAGLLSGLANETNPAVWRAKLLLADHILDRAKSQLRVSGAIATQNVDDLAGAGQPRLRSSELIVTPGRRQGHVLELHGDEAIVATTDGVLVLPTNALTMVPRANPMPWAEARAVIRRGLQMLRSPDPAMQREWMEKLARLQIQWTGSEPFERTVVDVVEELAAIVRANPNTRLGAEALEALARYGRGVSADWKIGGVGWAGPDILGSLARDPRLPDSLRFMAFSELRYAETMGGFIPPAQIAALRFETAEPLKRGVSARPVGAEAASASVNPGVGHVPAQQQVAIGTPVRVTGEGLHLDKVGTVEAIRGDRVTVSFGVGDKVSFKLGRLEVVDSPKSAAGGVSPATAGPRTTPASQGGGLRGPVPAQPDIRDTFAALERQMGPNLRTVETMGGRAAGNLSPGQVAELENARRAIREGLAKARQLGELAEQSGRVDIAMPLAFRLQARMVGDAMAEAADVQFDWALRVAHLRAGISVAEGEAAIAGVAMETFTANQAVNAVANARRTADALLARMGEVQAGATAVQAKTIAEKAAAIRTLLRRYDEAVASGQSVASVPPAS